MDAGVGAGRGDKQGGFGSGLCSAYEGERQPVERLSEPPEYVVWLRILHRPHSGEPVKIYHTGDNGGFQNYAASFPSCGVKVIVFANRNDFDRWTLVRQIDRILREEGVLE